MYIDSICTSSTSWVTASPLQSCHQKVITGVMTKIRILTYQALISNFIPWLLKKICLHCCKSLPRNIKFLIFSGGGGTFRGPVNIYWGFGTGQHLLGV